MSDAEPEETDDVEITTGRLHALELIVESECGEVPDEPDPDTYATMAGYGVVVGQCHARTPVDRTGVDKLLQEASAEGRLVQWPTDDARWYVPRTSKHLPKVVAEETARDDPDEELLDHLGDAIREVHLGGE